MRKYIIAMVLAFIAAPSCCSADSIAMLFHVAGKVEMQSSGTDAWHTARLLQRLQSGDRVRCGPGAEAGIVILSDGSRYLIPAGGSASVSPGTVQGAQPLGKPQGLSARAAEKLAGARTAAFMSRPAVAPQDIVYHFDGWLPAGTRKFSWADTRVFPNFQAAAYSFSLFDRAGNVIWSARTERMEAEAPPEVPAFDTERPYLWRLTGFTADGKPGRKVWGMVSFLSETQANELNNDIEELKKRRDAAKAARTLDPAEKAMIQRDVQYYTALMADFYRQHGVLMGAFDLLIGEVMDVDTIYREAGGLAQFFRGIDDANRDR